MEINGSDLIVALDYLKHCRKIIKIDWHVGYEDGTLNDLLNKLQSSFREIEVKIQNKE